MTTTLDLDTPHGPARAHVHRAAAGESARGALILGHGAGGSVGAPDLQAATRAARAAHHDVALVEQPYRVAGRRSPAPAHQLDAAWEAVVAQLAAGALAGLPLITGGRSSGARVACRTAAATGTTAVLCLAFPLEPPQRRADAGSKTPKTPQSRLPELEAVRVPVLVVQGEHDRFGIPPADPPRREVVVIAGDHGLKKDLPAVEAAVTAWLQARASPPAAAA